MLKSKVVFHFTLGVAAHCVGACGQTQSSTADAVAVQLVDVEDISPSDAIAASDLAPRADPGAAASDAVAAADIQNVTDISDVASTDAGIPACVQSAVPVVTAPGLFWNGDKVALLVRAKSPPFASIWADLQATAASNPGAFTGAPSLYARGNVAKAAALVGVVLNDAKLQKKAEFLIASLPHDVTWIGDLDDGLHISDGLVGHAVALHLLHGTGPVDPAADKALADLSAAFYTWATVDVSVAMAFWPNNHSTKVAGALGLAALTLPAAPGAGDWLAWSAATIDALWTQYLFAADGAYAEGPYYHMYADITVGPFVVALHRALVASNQKTLCSKVLCDTRLGWQPVCQDTTTVVGDLLGHERLLQSLNWLVNFVRPDGVLPPYADSNPVGYPAALWAGPLQHKGLQWMFINHPFVKHTADLAVESLLLWDDALGAEPPSQMEQVLNLSGTFLHKTGNLQSDLQAVLLAIPPKMTRSGHSHADALSLQIYAQGAPRLIDTGYSKWADHEKVNGPEQHNTLAIDDKGPVIPALLGAIVQPCALATSKDVWKAQMTLPGGDVHREVTFLPDATIQVTDHAIFSQPGSHKLAARWHALGGLTAAEDKRGVFVQLADGAKWTMGGVTTWVRAKGADISNDLRNDGLAYGEIKQHRCLIISTKSNTEATLISQIWIGPENQSPPWK